MRGCSPKYSYIVSVLSLEGYFNAKRPKWSVMSNEKICKDLGLEIKEWTEEMELMIEMLQSFFSGFKTP
jgi:dTDP-4-dehydrorhamnose reductase